MIDAEGTEKQDFPLVQYRKLAEFRYQLRNYLQYSEQCARKHGIEPQQHQLMLAIKGLPGEILPTVSALANRLRLRHHSTVELINRLVERGAAVRKPSQHDRRQVMVELTPLGEELLEKMSAEHQHELEELAPGLLQHLTAILQGPAAADGTGTHSETETSYRTAGASGERTAAAAADGMAARGYDGYKDPSAAAVSDPETEQTAQEQFV